MAVPTVLLVDDSQTVHFFGRLLMRRRGFRVVTAHDGAEGVRAAEREAPDLIIMDLNMPKMNGLEAAQAIRQLSVTAFTPIIMLTAHGADEYEGQAIGHGCTAFLNKPIDIPELLQAVDQYLPGYATESYCV